MKVDVFRCLQVVLIQKHVVKFHLRIVVIVLHDLENSLSFHRKWCRSSNDLHHLFFPQAVQPTLFRNVKLLMEKNCDGYFIGNFKPHL